MKSLSLLAATVAGLVAGAGFTQEATAQDAARAANSGPAFYLRAGLGGTFASDQNYDIEFGPTVLPVEPVPTDLDFDLGAGAVGAAALGFDFDFVRAELEYRYATSNVEGVTVDGEIIDLVELGIEDESSLDAHLFFANVYFDFDNSSKFTPFIGGGAGGAIVGDEESDTVFAYQGRAGVSYDFGGGLSGDLEFIYLRTDELTFGSLETDLLTFGGDRYESSSVMASIRKTF